MKFLVRKLETRPPHPNNVAALPCEKQLILRCLADSRQHTITHLPALLRATHLLVYYKVRQDIHR